MQIYEKRATRTTPARIVTTSKRLDETGLRVIDVFFRDSDGITCSEPATGKLIDLCIRVEAVREIEDVYASMIVRDAMHTEKPAFAITSDQDSRLYSLNSGMNEIILRFPAFPFAPGNYVFKV